jgi:hypothetical protein
VGSKTTGSIITLAFCTAIVNRDAHVACHPTEFPSDYTSELTRSAAQMPREALFSICGTRTRQVTESSWRRHLKTTDDLFDSRSSAEDGIARSRCRPVGGTDHAKD